jgi:5-methylcytosine-specific restriction endonuclease McrA
MSYEEQLKDRRWWMTRKVILIRDDNTCTRCGSKHHLQVHHKYYESGKMAWEYPFEALATLCSYCHGITHGKMPERTNRMMSFWRIVSDLLENSTNRG